MNDHRRVAPPAHAAKPATDSNAAGLRTAIDRLAAAIAEENTRLEAGGTVSVEDTVQKKSRALLEVTRFSRAAAAGLDPALSRRLADLRTALQRNEELLAMHLRAAREVAAIVGAAIAREDWDGTYEPLQARATP